MDMKSYILVGGGLLICLVLVHAFVSAWWNRRAPNADEAEADQDARDMDAEDRARILWHEDGEVERAGEPVVEELVADEEPGPPVSMESPLATDETIADAGVVSESPLTNAAEADHDETPDLETADTPRSVDEGPDGVRKGRRIDIPGKRTEPTVPRAMRPEFHDFASAAPREPQPESNVPHALDEVLVLWVFAKPGRLLDGETLLKTFVAHGLKCDTDRAFRKADPRCGGPWYTVANGVEPGTFDISRPVALESPGVVMLLNLGEVRDPGPAFEDMLDVAQDLAIALDAELKDEGMSDMSAQTIEHCRQRIRDHRRMLLRA